MEKIIEGLLTNPEQITFAILFVGLLVWVMKQNNEREKRYQGTIDKLTDALGDVESIKSTVDKIHEKLN
ncbi:BhlA/UviB family holin-like peptide [Candidatus Enterococcus mansonii]|uniref:BhlA/UviB family holin-like peptide n=1 Tax=Candidatus Enterococcus mansonii TaxID=1834181 RepID=UPI000A345E35|nr:BhlA/UviB family holin-like peptide [Enterococcus sp. 4G2_DIV0659]